MYHYLTAIISPSHSSQAKGDFSSAAELPLPAKSPSRIPFIYTALVIVPVVTVEQLVVRRGSRELVESFYISSGCFQTCLWQHPLNSLTELVLYPQPLLIFCRWNPLPSDSMRALSSTAVPSGSHRSMRLTWACFWSRASQ